MKSLVSSMILCLLLLGGCSAGPSRISGGTSGSLLAGDTPVPDFEVRIYATASTALLGLGTTGNDGKFQLVKPKGEGPLWLLPGEYAFTLESIGPETPRMPPAYGNASKTPLRVNWKSEDKALDLRIPAFK